MQCIFAIFFLLRVRFVSKPATFINAMRSFSAMLLAINKRHCGVEQWQREVELILPDSH